MRHEYETHGLVRDDLDEDPLVQFAQWLGAAVEAEVTEPNAMVLATVDEDGALWTRHLLLKGLSGGGFEFYTNYGSSKARQLADHDRAAMTFGWLQLHRQVNVSGRVSPLTAAESDEYFAVRPRESQLGAWASSQSASLDSRSELEARLESYRRRFEGGAVPRPEHWGGYRLVPYALEFWQGRPSRLHDRFRYERSASGEWTIRRLYP